MQLVEGGQIELAVVVAAGAIGGLLALALFAALFFLWRFGGGGGFLGCCVDPLRRRLVGVEAGFEVADAQGFPVEAGVPVEGCIADGEVVAIGTVDGLEDGSAVFDGAADGAELVHGPAEGHGAGAWYEAKGGAQAGDAAAGGGRGDGAQRLRADGEGNASGGGRRCG